MTEIDINQIIQKAYNYHKEGKNEDAADLYKKILKTQPDNFNIYNNLGAALKKLNKLQEAEFNFQKALDINPNFVDAIINIGNLQYTLGKFVESETSFKKAIELKPDYAVAHYNFGNIKQKLNRLEEAETSFKKAIELKPDYVIALNDLALTQNELNKPEEAENNYKKAIIVNPNYINSYYNLAALLYSFEKIDEAETYLDKALLLSPKGKQLLKLKGQILFQKGNFKEALKNFDLCDSESSRSFSLASLYSLGRIEDIYQRIDEGSKLDKKNLWIAAFASFIAHKEKKDTANKFCKNPLDFINYSNISLHIENANSFISEIIKELSNVKIRWEPFENTTKKGFHTGNKVNLFNKPLNKMNDLYSIILVELHKYKLKFKKEDCTYIKNWPTKSFLSGWHVILKQQGYQKAHIHPSGWLSGVIYLKVVPNLGKNEGAIEFSLNGNHYSDFNSPKIVHQPKVGDVILFPSSLHHRTIPFSTDTSRMIVSFDLVPIL